MTATKPLARSSADWGRLGLYVLARRKVLGMTTRMALAQSTGLSYRLHGDIERGARSVSDGTLAILEQALAWQPGSAREILSGREPTLITPPSDVSPKASDWIRSLSEAYRISADLAELGHVGLSGRLLRALTDISQSAVMAPFRLQDVSAEFRAVEREFAGSGNGAQPTVIGIALGRYMRHLRESRYLSQERVGRLLGWPTSDIWLLEFGRIVLDKEKIRRLLTLYGEDSPHVQRECLRLASQSEKSGWWTKYNDETLPDWFRIYLHLEQCADVIRTFEAHFIPGLLQTERYARSIMGFPVTGGLEHRVHLRMERQRILDRRDSPRLWVVIDEMALKRPPVDADVMNHQIAHLISMTKRRNVVIQILSTEKPLNAFSSSFSLLKFHEPQLPHIVYTEQLTSAIYLDERKDIQPYMSLLDELCTEAMAPRESTEYLRRLLWNSSSGALNRIP